eukprot:scaffold109957_cov26-Tisochrysis_lutea.AAC.2
MVGWSRSLLPDAQNGWCLDRTSGANLPRARSSSLARRLPSKPVVMSCWSFGALRSACRTRRSAHRL